MKQVEAQFQKNLVYQQELHQLVAMNRETVSLPTEMGIIM